MITKGKWKVVKTPIGDTGIRTDDGFICFLVRPSRFDRQEARYAKEMQQQADDAQLIASAPETLRQRDALLEALKESRRRLVFLHQAIMGETKPIFDDIEIRKTGSCIIFIDEAIANATEDKIIDDADLCNRLAKGDPPEI